MSAKVLELKRQRKELVAKMAPLADKDALSAEEEKSFGEMKSQVEGLARAIERNEFVEGEKAVLSRLDGTPAKPQPEGLRGRRREEETFGFESVGEFVATLRFSPDDDRIHAAIKAQMEMGTGEKGGVMVPPAFQPTLRQVSPQGAIFRPRATVVPAGDQPDAEFVMPALNQKAGKGVYAGVSGAWLAEGVTKPETDATLRDIRWRPKEYACHIPVTDTLLRNWAGSGALIESLLRAHLAAAEDAAFLSGDGTDRPLGVLASDALKKVNRTTVDTVVYPDLVAMEAELLADADSAWIVNPRVKPILRLMKDDADRYIWVDNARDGEPPTLLGRPVILNYRSPAVGDLGDVLLASGEAGRVLSHYIIKDGVGPLLSASPHVKFLENKTVVKAFLTVDGKPWLDAPIAQEDGQTYSPFVALDVPA